METKTVSTGIYQRFPTGKFVGNSEQFRTECIGTRTYSYTFEALDEGTILINGIAYRVEEDSEFAIKVMKTKVKAMGGAPGLVRFFMGETLDSWELKVIETCKPLN